MRKTKKLAALMLAGAMAASLAACGGQTASTDTTAAESADGEESKEAEQTADGETYKIGVLQLTQHVALDKTNEGFVAALDDAGIKYEIDQQNAAGEQSACQTIAEKLVNDKDDLIFAIATPAAQAVAGVTDSIPILVSAVTDPAASGLVESNEVPGGNVSGTSDLTPVKEQIDLMQQIIPDVKKVGLLYCSAEANSVLQIDMAKEALDTAGIEYEDYTVSNSNEIPTVVESMVGNVDCVYTPTDNMIAAGMATVTMVTNENKLPVICGEKGMVDAGGLATYGIDYYQLGYMTGEQAVKIRNKGRHLCCHTISLIGSLGNGGNRGISGDIQVARAIHLDGYSIPGAFCRRFDTAKCRSRGHRQAGCLPFGQAGDGSTLFDFEGAADHPFIAALFCIVLSVIAHPSALLTQPSAAIPSLLREGSVCHPRAGRQGSPPARW